MTLAILFSLKTRMHSSRMRTVRSGSFLGGGVVSQHALRQTPPPVNRMTDRYKNITFATSLRTVTMWSRSSWIFERLENSITSVIAMLTLTLGVNEPLNRPLVHHYYHRCLQLLNSVDFLQVRDYRYYKIRRRTSCKQECIPVGCVPSATVAVCWGGCLPQCMLGYHQPPRPGTPQSRYPLTRHPRSRPPPPVDRQTGVKI